MMSLSNSDETSIARVLVPRTIATSPIPGKNLPFETLDRPKPMLVYVIINNVPPANAARKSGNVSIIQAQPLPIDRISTK